MYAALAMLAAAIGIEVAATATLPRTNGFTDPWWTVFVIGGYAVSIWLLAIIVRTIPVSVAYAIWAGLGTAAVAVVGALFLGEAVTPLKIVSLAMICVGVVGLNLAGAH